MTVFLKQFLPDVLSSKMTVYDKADDAGEIFQLHICYTCSLQDSKPPTGPPLVVVEAVTASASARHASYWNAFLP